MSYPTTLSGLSPREAIQDTLSRCVLGLDSPDEALFKSAFHDDAVFDLNSTQLEGWDAIKTGCYDRVARLDTTHFLSNVRIDVKKGASKNTASVTCSALAQHYRGGEGQKPDATRLLTGGLYTFDLVKDETKDEEFWKIKRWGLKVIWAEGDWGVVREA